MYYVTTTDKFLSGWGLAEGKISKLVFECESMEEAMIVAENAKARSDQKNVNICSTKPHYPANTHYTQIKTKEKHPSWYKKGYFKS